MTERIANQDVNKGLMDGLLKSEYYLKKSGLDLKLIELMKYRVSQINGCAFCLDMHHKEAIHMGETALRIYSLAAWRECPFYSEKERAVFAFAEALTLASQKDITDEVYQNLEKYFTKAEIADLTLAVTQINTWNRLNKVFRPVPGNYVPGQYA
jgi:AhpD family alkylhydroperoxidase